MFFGREDVFAFIRRNLIGRHSNHPIVLYGQRRTGKTSVLYQLYRHLDPGYWCVFIDLHGLNLNGLGNLMQGIATVISRELRRDHQVTVEVPDRAAFLADPATAFERVFLDQVWAALGGNQLVLMLDEVVRLDEEMRAGRLNRGVFDYLRHLMQHHERLNFVFSLGSGIEEMSRDYAFLFSVSLYHRISFLEPSAARDLITLPAHGHYELTEQAVGRILQITSGHAYYTQLVCHCLFDAWTRNHATTIDVNDVDDVLTEAIELGSANLTYVWLDSSPAEQVLMAGIATTMRDGGTTVTADQVRQVWSNAGVDVPVHEITRALRGLAGREVIMGDSAYSFTVDLQRLWLDEHRRLDRVKDDLADQIAPWSTPELPAGGPERSPADEDTEDSAALASPPAGAGDDAGHLDMSAFEELLALPDAGYGAPALVSRTAHNTYRLDGGRDYSIGRDERADIVLTDARVSWAHAVLRAEGPVWVLADLGSRNGTFVGSEPIGRLEINAPCVVHFGHPQDGPVLRFELAQPESEQAEPALPEQRHDPQAVSEDTTFATQPKRRRGTLIQTMTMARRFLRATLADRAFTITIVLMPILLGGLVRATPAQFGLDNGPGELAGININAIQMLLILVLSSVLFGTALSIREFTKERDVYERDRMAGLSATAYLFSKVIVLSAFSVLQTAFVVLIGLAGQKIPPRGVVIPGSALIEIFVALAVLGVVSMLIGLAVSTLGEQSTLILVGVTMVQFALSGGFFPLSGKALTVLSSVAPARWGLGAIASTINLNAIQASEYTGSPYGQQPDALWTHDAAHWLVSMAAMIFIGLIWLIIARARLASIGPHERKQPVRQSPQ
jgi:hypothetical protein